MLNIFQGLVVFSLIIIIILLSIKLVRGEDYNDLTAPDKIIAYPIQGGEIDFYNKIEKYNNKINILYNKLPDNFILGFSSAPYQYEGAQTKDGRGLTNWDEFLLSGHQTLNNTGQFATNFYYAFENDLERMRLMGVDSFRIGIAWSRILPEGELTKPNQDGINFYTKVIRTMIKKQIKPVICLFHWDYPLTLQNKLVTGDGKKRAMGFTDKDKNKNGKLLKDIFNDAWTHYTKVVYNEILKPYWSEIYYISSINEILTIASNGYANSAHCPGYSVNRNQSSYGMWNGYYWSIYNMLMMHSIVYKVHDNMRKSSKSLKNPKCTVDSYYASCPIRYTPKAFEDKPGNGLEARDPDPVGMTCTDETFKRAMDFNVWIVLDPFYLGEWPDSVKKLFKDQDQAWRDDFPPVDIRQFRGQMDNLIPMHYYFGQNISDLKPQSKQKQKLADYFDKRPGADNRAAINETASNIFKIDSRAIYNSSLVHNPPAPYNKDRREGGLGQPVGTGWLGWYPAGCTQLLNEMYMRYNAGRNSRGELIPIHYLMTEFGTCETTLARRTVHESTNDWIRVELYTKLLNSLLDRKKSLIAKHDVFRGILCWSFSDNLEWGDGYKSTFGFYYINFNGPGVYAARTPKLSTAWFKLMTLNKGLPQLQDANKKELYKYVRTCAEKNTLLDTKYLDKPLDNIILLGQYTYDMAGNMKNDINLPINGYAMNVIDHMPSVNPLLQTNDSGQCVINSPPLNDIPIPPF